MFFRDDVVWLMRRRPTDWSDLDMKDVAPTDCATRRVMIEEGAQNMRDLGTFLAVNEAFPARIVVSERCRNRQTARLEGMGRVDPEISAAMLVETDGGLNLLLSPQATPMRDVVSAWGVTPRGPVR